MYSKSSELEKHFDFSFWKEQRVNKTNSVTRTSIEQIKIIDKKIQGHSIIHVIALAKLMASTKKTVTISKTRNQFSKLHFCPWTFTVRHEQKYVNIAFHLRHKKN